MPTKAQRRARTKQRREFYADLRAQGYTGRQAGLRVHQEEMCMKKPTGETQEQAGRRTRLTENRRETKAEWAAGKDESTLYRELYDGRDPDNRLPELEAKILARKRAQEARDAEFKALKPMVDADQGPAKATAWAQMIQAHVAKMRLIPDAMGRVIDLCIEAQDAVKHAPELGLPKRPPDLHLWIQHELREWQKKVAVYVAAHQRGLSS
jgi:hypothetical protein